MADPISDDARIRVKCPNDCMKLTLSYRAFLRLYNVPYGLVDTDRFLCPDCLEVMKVKVLEEGEE